MRILFYKHYNNKTKRVNPETILQAEIVNACLKLGIELKRVNTQGLPVISDGRVKSWRKSRNVGAADLTGALKRLGGRRLEIEVKTAGTDIIDGSAQADYRAWALSQGALHLTAHSVAEVIDFLKQEGAI